MTELEALWEDHGRAFRDPREVATQWHDSAKIIPEQLKTKTRGGFFGLLDDLGVTLIVTREYEHLVAGIAGRRVSYLPLPHPNGLAWDPHRETLHVASTRNPNMIYSLGRTSGQVTVGKADPRLAGLLVPRTTRSLPGSTYIHDLAMIAGRLHANAVSMNAVAEIKERSHAPVWWPRSIDSKAGPRFDTNYLQLNSIAAGKTLKSSYFTASAEAPGRTRPGMQTFPVDRRGVLFSGRTREVAARGLTRPHSARFSNGRVFVANSGYGELVVIDRDDVEVVARLPGWTRGLCFVGDLAFVATSRIIQRFACYAPGLDPDRSICAVHAVDIQSGRVLAALEWPVGNQVFAIEALPREFTRGFPFTGKEKPGFIRDLFFRAEVV